MTHLSNFTHIRV